VLTSDCQFPVFVGDAAYCIVKKMGKNTPAAERKSEMAAPSANTKKAWRHIRQTETIDTVFSGKCRHALLLAFL